MLSKVKQQLKTNLINLPGWRTNRKIIVIESDDWGATRMFDKKAYNSLLKKGYAVDRCPYNRNDRIENNDDISILGETLLKHRDKNNQPAIFTLNNIVANPNFDKIKNASFQKYYYETFQKTLSRYNDTANSISLIKEGIKSKVFKPQLHGREHLNISLWLKRLRSNEKKFLDAFKHNMFTVTGAGQVSGRRDNLDTYGHTKLIANQHNFIKNIQEAQNLFYKAWGFYSETFIAPCYVWHPDLEKILANNNIKGIQGTHVQRIPLAEGYKVKRKYHYTGQKNKYNQVYLSRNVMFEPTEQGQNGAVHKAMNEIHIAFKHKKPAIISSHRVNYIGSLNLKNREINIKQLDTLLMEITKQWKDVEFMSSDQLLNLIQK